MKILFLIVIVDRPLVNSRAFKNTLEILLTERENVCMGHFMRVADVDSFTKKLQFIFFFWIRASLGTYWWVVTFSHFVKIGSTIKQNLSDYIMLYFELVMLFYRYIKHCQNGKSATTNAHKRSILKSVALCACITKPNLTQPKVSLYNPY